MKFTRRPLLFAAAGVALLGVLAYAFMPRPAPVEIVRVASGPLRVTVDEDGRTRIKERYAISTPLGGQLRRIELHSGDAVRAGVTVLASIDPVAPALLDARTRAQLEARLRAAEAQADLAGPRVERARATQELAQRDYVRVTRLADEKAVSRQELDRSREAARVAAEDLKVAEYARRIAGFELEQARAALARSIPGPRSEECTGEMKIVAPVDGRVLRVWQEDSAVVAPGTRLLEIGDPSDLEAEIDVLSSDAVRIPRGARVLFEHWGGDAPLEGRVRVVEPAGFLKISALGVEEQRVNVIADLVTPPAQRRTLGDAYRVEARIVVWESDQVLKAPVGALFRHQGAWAVFALRGGRARLTKVEVGHGDGREVELRGGLAAGDEVVVHASDKVSDGVRVTVRAQR
ncbi:MAG: efflux RND transporter periplasmic adaptor subunit [Opitutaceae bacterium]|nr:efflux RND transporter periplasmic adaptor subunit [Opitutaceae bacterium]